MSERAIGADAEAILERAGNCQAAEVLNVPNVTVTRHPARQMTQCSPECEQTTTIKATFSQTSLGSSRWPPLDMPSPTNSTIVQKTPSESGPRALSVRPSMGGSSGMDRRNGPREAAVRSPDKGALPPTIDAGLDSSVTRRGDGRYQVRRTLVAPDATQR